MKAIFTCFFSLLTLFAFAQVPVSAYSGVNHAAATSINNMPGWTTADPPYSNSTNYDIYYGREDAATTGSDRLINSFSIASGAAAGIYTPVLFEPAKPFDTVVVKRIDNATTTGRRVNSLYEMGSFDAGINTLYLRTSYSATMEDLVNTRFINIGSDNMFVNEASTENNIERIDLIFSIGIKASADDLAKVGLLINERGGNDYFKAAAITGLNAVKQVTSLGSLVSITPADWGQVGPSISTVVMSKEESDAFLRPKEDIGTQTISGVFISLADLGVPANTFIRGVSLFPNDVNSGNDLVGLSDVPTNTAGGSVGGLDLMAGGGFFSEAGATAVLPIKFLSVGARKISSSSAGIDWRIFSDDPEPSNFVLERSADGIHWIKIATIPGIAHGGANQSFSYTDNDPFSNENFYRVISIGAGNNYTYSKTVYLYFDTDYTDTKITSIPGSGKAWIHSGDAQGQFILRMIGFNGQLLKQQTVVVNRNSVLAIDLNPQYGRHFIMQLLNGNRIMATQKIIR